MVDVAVIVPWRGGDPDRERAWAWCERMWRYHQADWQLVVAQAPEGPWCKASAVQAGLQQTDASTIVVADADVWCDGVGQAVHAVQELGGWAVPHRLVWRLSREQTVAVVDWQVPPETFGPASLEEPPYPGVVGGGVVVVDRATWTLAPLDPRFVGWGGEDAAWGYALSAQAGPGWRGSWRLWHLWHPPQARLSRQTGSRESERLRKRYRLARRRPLDMARLTAEANHNLTL